MINKLDNKFDKNMEFSNLIDMLNENIERNSNNIKLLEKMAIILLVTKLETYLENKTRDWFEILKQDNMNTAYNLSNEVKKQIIRDTVDNVYNELSKGVISANNRNKLKNFNMLLDEFYPLSELDIDFKLTLNEHGSNEIIKLLRKIGIDDIFNKMDDLEKINIKVEVVAGINVTTKIDYKSKINTLINYRNNAIHEDILNNISYRDLNLFINSTNLLLNTVDNYLESLENYQNVKCSDSAI